MKFILMINVKMPKNVGILTLISRIHTTSESFKSSKILIFAILPFIRKMKFHVQHVKSIFTFDGIIVHPG